MAIPSNTKFISYSGRPRNLLDGSGNPIEVVPKTYTVDDIADYVAALVGKRWTVIEVTENHTANDHEFVLADAVKGAFTVTLPTLADNLWVTIKKIDASANVVTVTPGVSGFIDGAATLTISGQWDSYDFYCDGSNWFIR